MDTLERIRIFKSLARIELDSMHSYALTRDYCSYIWTMATNGGIEGFQEGGGGINGLDYTVITINKRRISFNVISSPEWEEEGRGLGRKREGRKI